MPVKRKAEREPAQDETDPPHNAEVSSTLSPEDPRFLESLRDADLRMIADAALEEKKDAQVRLDALEFQLRRAVLQRIREAAPDLGEFWTGAARLCLHLVYMAEVSQDSRYTGLHARKIPFVLLEDIFDCLSSQLCASFWHKHCLGSFEVIFGQRMWLPSPTQHPCWLPFLKISNKLIRRLPPKDSGSILLTLCRVFPLSERSGTRWGSHNAANVTAFESEQEFQEEQLLSPTLPFERSVAENGSTLSDPPEDYGFYQSFWKLQADLNHPSGLPATAVPAFLERLKLLVTALESQPLSSNFPSSSSYMRGSKYLTGSHLISYQVKDPEFRVHILSQILIACHHLSAGGPALRTKFREWDQRSRDLLSKMGTMGSRHLALLDSIFERSEKAWRKWKKEKCEEDLDKTLSQPLETRKKRKSLGGVLSSTDEEENESLQALTLGVMDPAELATASKQMRCLLPSFPHHLSDYVEALDPEAGIEAEYHPRNDKVFSWRALRVVSRHYLRHLPLVHVDGDFEGLVRHVYKEDHKMNIPGEDPSYAVEDFEEKDEDPSAEQQIASDVKDEVMEDAQDTEIVVSPENARDDLEPKPDELKSQEDSKVARDVDEMKSTQMEVCEESTAEQNNEDSVAERNNDDSRLLNGNPTASAPEEDGTKPNVASAKKVRGKTPPPTESEARARSKFTPPPGKEMPSLKYADIDKQAPADYGARRKEDPMDTKGSGAERRSRDTRLDSRGRGIDRGRNQHTRNDRGPPFARDDTRGGREERGAPAPNRNEWGDRAPLSRRDDHRMQSAGRGFDRDDRRGGGGRGTGGGGGGRGVGGGHRAVDRGPPSEHWDDQRRHREDRMDDRRDGDDRHPPTRRRHRN